MYSNSNSKSYIAGRSNGSDPLDQQVRGRAARHGEGVVHRDDPGGLRAHIAGISSCN